MTAIASRTEPHQEQDLEQLRMLPSVLLREGYVDAYLAYGLGHLALGKAAQDTGYLPPRTRQLVELFLLNGFVARADVAEALGEALTRTLEGLGVLLGHEGERVHTGGLMALPQAGMLVFILTPVSNPAVYFGDDTVALSVRLMPKQNGRCLDLCAGPGTQALVASRAGGRVVAVEINPIAAAVAELNVAMNGLTGRMEVRRGDLYAALREDERFDLVSANPPLLPFVPELPYPFVGHGGGDGLKVTRRILEGLPRVLAPGGTAQVIGTCLGDQKGPFPIAELTAYAAEHALHVVMTVPSRLPLGDGAHMFEGLSQTCAVAMGLPVASVRDRFRAHLDGLSADHLYFYYLTITQDSPHPGFTATEHWRRPGGFWFR